MNFPATRQCWIISCFILLVFNLKLVGSCGSDGPYCGAVMNANALMGTPLDYKCAFPVFLAKMDILKLDPTTFITMKISQYCQASCCSVAGANSPPVTTNIPTTVTIPASPSTTPSSTTTTTTRAPTTVTKDLLQQFNDAMNKNGGFKGLLNEIHFNSSALDGLLRFQKYAEEKKTVTEHNIDYKLGISTYKMATNQFSVAFDDEIAPLSLSLDKLKPQKFVIDNDVGNGRKKRDSATNDTVDWRPIMKPILNQLTCGGCWAFSLTAMLEGFFAISNIQTTSLSVQQLITCDTAKDPTLGLANKGCLGGYFQVASTYLKVRGERNSEDIPFDMSDTSCDTSLFPPVAPTLLTFDQGYISSTNDTTKLAAMEQNIEEKVRKGPVSVGMAVSQDIYNYGSGIYDGNCGDSINHAVVIVGFTSEYWIIRNSWGPAWGENGYMRLKRTSGSDPCMLYQYWSQAVSIGANETFLPPKTGNGYVVVSTNGSTVAPATVTSETGNGEEICEAICDCDDDDEDDVDYEDSDEDGEASSSSSSISTLTSTSKPTSTAPKSTTKRTTSASSAKTTTRRSTTTTKRTTTTTTIKPSLFDRWWNNVRNFG